MVLGRGGRISGGLILGVLTSKMRSFLLVDNTFGGYTLWGLGYHLIVERLPKSLYRRSWQSLGVSWQSFHSWHVSHPL
jgi:hypothetical protein